MPPRASSPGSSDQDTLAFVWSVCAQISPRRLVHILIRAVSRCYLPKLRDDESDRRRQVHVPAADDTGFAPESQRVMIDRDDAVRLLIQENLRRGETKAICRSYRREDQ